MNYITNAIRHSGEGTEVVVTIYEVQDEVRIGVYNEGEPIKEETKEHLWESFYRADKARTRNETKCIGLGLYLVSAIMKHQGGSYGVENEDRGVKFWLGIKQ